MAPVPILVYHSVTDSPSTDTAPLAVPPGEFLRQLDYLSEQGFRGVSVSEALEAARRDLDGRAPRRVVGLSFDDGYANFHSFAYPALEARNFRVSLYLTTSWVGLPAKASGPGERMLTWSQVKELAAEGVEIGAHSHTHPELDTARPDRLRQELQRPRSMIEEAVQRPVHGLAYPHGYNSARVRRAVSRVGYRHAVSVHNRAHHRAEDILDVSRFMPTRNTSLEQLQGWVHRAADLLRRGDTLATRAWRLARMSDALLHGSARSHYA